MLYGYLRSKHTVFKLTDSKILIGRDLECDVIIQSTSVSARHAILEFLPSRTDNTVMCILRDLNSTNGTYINETRVPSGKSITLSPLDTIRFGYDVNTFRVELCSGAPLENVSPSSRKVAFNELSFASFLKQSKTDKIKEDDESTLNYDFGRSSILKRDLKSPEKNREPMMKEMLDDKTLPEKVLDQLEERISNLEETAVSQKRFPEKHVSIIQQTKLLTIQNLAKQIKFKIMKFNFHYPGKHQSTLINLKPDMEIFDENSNIIDILEDIKDSLEYANRELDFMNETNSPLAEKLINSQAEHKSRQLEIYARSLEQKISEFRVKTWEQEKQIKNLEKLLHQKSVDEDEVLNLKKTNQMLEEKVQNLSKESINKEEIMEQLKELQKRNIELQGANELLKKQLHDTQEYSNYLQSITDSLKTPSVNIPVQSNKEDECVTYLSKVLVEKEKMIHQLKNEILNLSKIKAPQFTTPQNKSANFQNSIKTPNFDVSSL